MKMIYVLLQIAAKHQDIIDVGETIRKVSKDRIHHPLEGVPCIPEAKGKAQKLEHPEWSDDRCLTDIFFSHQNLVIPLLKVQLRKDG